MLNKNVLVPENTIVAFKLEDESVPKDLNVLDFISKPSNKRDWFTPLFYHCLPLSIGNQTGFVISLDFGFTAVWNGGDRVEDLSIAFSEEVNVLNKFDVVHSNFGHGVITISLPWSLRTPPNVNLLTVAPPNYILNNATPMTGSVETDNLRGFFTFNIRVQEPNRFAYFPANTPICAFIPIPRYFATSFTLKNAEEVFSQEVIEEEVNIYAKMVQGRRSSNAVLDKDYFKGRDLEGNEFEDHQPFGLQKKV